MTISFTVLGTPVGKARARTVSHGGRIHSYTPEKTANYEKAVAWECKKACQGRRFAPETPLRIEAWMYMPIPKSLSKAATARLMGTWHTKKPDSSNILKSVEDAVIGIAYDDDNQIAETVTHKVYGDVPRVEVTIEPLEERSRA